MVLSNTPDYVRDQFDIARVATPTNAGYECSLPFSYDEVGRLRPRRVNTALLPRRFTIWLHLDDGTWVRRDVGVPAEVNGERVVTITGTEFE